MRKLVVILLVILAVVFVFIYLNRPSVTILCDASFTLAYPKDALKDFRRALSGEGYNLKTVTITPQALTEEQVLREQVSKYSDSALVLTTPVVSLAVKLAGLDLTQMVKGLSVGMTPDSEGCFDIVLPADSDSMPEGTYYTDAIGRDGVENLVYPDLALSVVPLLKLDKENIAIAEGIMVYGVK